MLLLLILVEFHSRICSRIDSNLKLLKTISLYSGWVQTFGKRYEILYEKYYESISILQKPTRMLLILSDITFCK